jgi:hypothetical protein
VINRELVMRGLAVRIGTRGLAVRIGMALHDGGVANMSCSGSSSEGRLCVRLGGAKLGMLKQGEGVHVTAVRKGFELRIAAALSERGVRISNRSNNNSNVGRLRVQACVNERHLLKDERESIRGTIESAVLRAEVKGSRRRNMQRAGRAIFRHHFDRGRKRKSRIKNKQR